MISVSRLILPFFVFCLTISGALCAEEKMINIKVAQYKTSFEFICPAGGTWATGGTTGTLSARDTAVVVGTLQTSAVKQFHVMVASVPLNDSEKLNQTIAKWEAAGWQVHTLIVGINDHYDSRVALIGVGIFGDAASAQPTIDAIAASGNSSWIFEEIISRSQGSIKLSVNGQVQAVGEELTITPKNTTLLKKVEYGMGYPWHGFADRNYRGNITCQWGAQDAMDCILNTSLETVLAGVVPSEISANAVTGALQAQAVAARGEILSKIGRRHINEGFDTCSEQHCQVFSGETADALAVAQKIAPTAGYVLTENSGAILDAVYSSNCGGHSEANHFVWTTQPNPILSGVWDSPSEINLDLSEEEQVGVHIKSSPACFCNDPNVEGGDKFRWKKSVPAADWKSIQNSIGVGRINKITDIARGYSGRIYRMTFIGESGNKTIMKELNIRKLFGGLRSSCFVADYKADANGFIVSAEISGAGFGHGVGMCQTGAQSMARRGYSFSQILIHYFPGSVLKKLY
ncbi:MAG: SpoIID/LytB domain-containing protein [Candidatus Riflebacteria bacterium]|nr:SpoIID/LytB domain-containing protein [Candidatus Riflebacteria bacterium]